MGIQDAVVGLDQLRDHLLALGYEVRVSTEAERARLGSRPFDKDQHCLTVSNRPFDVISVRLEGGVGPLENLGLRAGHVSVGLLPIRSRTVLPIKAHYVVLCEPGRASPELAARFKLRKQGLLSRRVVGGSWEGGAFATRLNGDQAMIDMLVSSLGARQGLEVVPDPGASCIRVVHRSSRVLDFSLFKPGLVSFDQDMAPPALLEAIGRVASWIRDALRPDAR